MKTSCCCKTTDGKSCVFLGIGKRSCCEVRCYLYVQTQCVQGIQSIIVNGEEVLPPEKIGESHWPDAVPANWAWSDNSGGAIESTRPCFSDCGPGIPEYSNNPNLEHYALPALNENCEWIIEVDFGCETTVCHIPFCLGRTAIMVLDFDDFDEEATCHQYYLGGLLYTYETVQSVPGFLLNLSCDFCELPEEELRISLGGWIASTSFTVTAHHEDGDQVSTGSQVFEGAIWLIVPAAIRDFNGNSLGQVPCFVFDLHVVFQGTITTSFGSIGEPFVEEVDYDMVIGIVKIPSCNQSFKPTLTWLQFYHVVETINSDNETVCGISQAVPNNANSSLVWQC